MAVAGVSSILTRSEVSFKQFVLHEHLLLKIWYPRPGLAYPLSFTERVEIIAIGLFLSLLYNMNFILHCDEAETLFDPLLGGEAGSGGKAGQISASLVESACRSFTFTLKDWSNFLLLESFNSLLFMMLPRLMELALFIALQSCCNRKRRGKKTKRAHFVELIALVLVFVLVYSVFVTWQSKSPDPGVFFSFFLPRFVSRWVLSLTVFELLFLGVWFALSSPAPPPEPIPRLVPQASPSPTKSTTKSTTTAV